MWSDTKNMSSWLKAVVREDPNIIMIWELRDKETVEAALEIAWTWYLVISTLHTSSAAQTLSRLISFFEPALQEGIKNKLWDVMSGILCQRLIKKADWKWRIWIYELMLPTSWIRNLIRSGEFPKIKSEIETWKQHGMITMHDYANRLWEKWLINKEDYEKYFMDDM
jgi:twitching motility protein PilT